MSSRSSHHRWSHSSDPQMTPSRLSHYSNFSSYSATSTSRASTSSASASSQSSNSFARSFAGIFVACFSSPEKEVPLPASIDKWRRTSGDSRSKRGGKFSYNSTVDSAPGSVRFTLAQIYEATNNFSLAFKIGQGGFGIVYRGILRDGTLVAVKRAKKSVYDAHTGPEFRREVQILTQVYHLNLVKFYGYLEEEEEKILVVEYVPNGTLREHLDGIHGDTLDMAKRLDIAIDVAHAITYLHMYSDHPIIHRDIKSSNILLTEKYHAKVADFGFARLGADEEAGQTHVSTQVKGTVGYLDPEYLRTHQLTDKSDVYSFGILLIELVTGRRPVDTKRQRSERLTPIWAMKKFTDGQTISTLDPMLEMNAANSIALGRVLELAFKCIAPEKQMRPTMRRCGEILFKIRKDYREILASVTQSSFSPHGRGSNPVTDNDPDEEHA